MKKVNLFILISALVSQSAWALSPTQGAKIENQIRKEPGSEKGGAEKEGSGFNGNKGKEAMLSDFQNAIAATWDTLISIYKDASSYSLFVQEPTGPNRVYTLLIVKNKENGVEIGGREVFKSFFRLPDDGSYYGDRLNADSVKKDHSAEQLIQFCLDFAEMGDENRAPGM